MGQRHLIKHWKGSRASYNYLKSHNALDAWTNYIVIENDNSISEYFGNNVAVRHEGQQLPVKDILPAEPPVSAVTPYDRYLIGTDALGYKIVEYTLDKEANVVKEELNFDKKYGVRVESKGLKNYVYVQNKLVTYDDMDGGEF